MTSPVEQPAHQKQAHHIFWAQCHRELLTTQGVFLKALGKGFHFRLLPVQKARPMKCKMKRRNDFPSTVFITVRLSSSCSAALHERLDPTSVPQEHVLGDQSSSSVFLTIVISFSLCYKCWYWQKNKTYWNTIFLITTFSFISQICSTPHWVFL